MLDDLNASIGEARAADLSACAWLYTLHSGGTLQDAEGRLRRELSLPGHLLLVARAPRDGAGGGDECDGGEVIGYGRVVRHESQGADREAPSGAYLGGVVVDPDHRRASVGTALTVARMRWVLGGPDEQLFYFTNARNRASIALHERLGFREITRDFRYPGVRFDGGVGILFRADALTAPGQWRAVGGPQRGSENRR
ncbi:GNAT family N-acetyltransferase [Streptomyces bauhiniae]